MDEHDVSWSDSGQTVQPAVRRRIERSCILCHRRKVKCDKQVPCSNCTRAGILCCYTPGEKQDARKGRTTISDIVSRLGQLERTIIAISSSADRQGDDHGGAPRPAIKTPSPNCNHNKESAGVSREGILLHHREYINDALLSRVIEGEQEVRSILMASSLDYQPEPHPTRSSLPFGLLGMISWIRPPVLPSLDGLYPQKWQAVKLWQAYLQNVEFQNKLLHIPTTQVSIYQAIHDPETAPAKVKCLLFAIYFAATISLSPPEVPSILSLDKVTALDNFRLGLELSLSAANFFNEPNLMGIQALGIYLQAIRALKHERSVWILLGVAIRTAQSIGLHRDPSTFAVSPFEAEMRRRLWWHLVVLDSRTDEDYGFTISLCSLNADTRLPLAVDDGALSPAMTELPSAPANTCTEMTFRLLIFMACRTMYELGDLIYSSGSVPSEAARHQLIKDLEDQIESHTSCCNPVIPTQLLTIKVPRLMVRRMEFTSRHQLLLLKSKNEDQSMPLSRLANTVTDDGTLAEACTIIEMALDIQTDALLYNFRWCSETHAQHSTLLYVLWYLCVRPTAPDSVRAWAAIEGAFQIETNRLRRQGVTSDSECSGSKWKVLRALREKAARLREPEPCETEQIEIKDGGARIDMAPMGEAAGVYADDFMAWNTDFVDWTSLMEDFATRN